MAETVHNNSFSCKGMTIAVTGMFPMCKTLNPAHPFLFTGGARGLGFCFCNSLAKAGANIAAIDILPSPVPEFSKLETYGIKAKFYR
jgi:hypothetical protein